MQYDVYVCTFPAAHNIILSRFCFSNNSTCIVVTQIPKYACIVLTSSSPLMTRLGDTLDIRCPADATSNIWIQVRMCIRNWTAMHRSKTKSHMLTVFDLVPVICVIVSITECVVHTLLSIIIVALMSHNGVKSTT